MLVLGEQGYAVAQVEKRPSQTPISRHLPPLQEEFGRIRV